MATEEELANIAAATTAPIIPFEASRRSVNYIKNYVPDLSNRSEYTQIDLKKLMKSMDDFIKFVGYKPKDFDMTLLSELLTAPGDMTHYTLADVIGDDFLVKINDIGVVESEKKVGKILVDLINLEEDITIKTMNKLANAGLDANDISLFDKYNETIAHVIDQSMDNLKRLSGNLNSTPLEIATLMKQGKFAAITGTENDIFDIATSVSEYVTNAKIQLTRTVVTESVELGKGIAALSKYTPEQIKNFDAERNLISNIDYEIGKNKQLTATTLQETLDSYKTFLVDKTKDYLNRTDNFYWRLTNSRQIQIDDAFVGDVIKNIEHVTGEQVVTYSPRIIDGQRELKSSLDIPQAEVEKIVKKKLPKPISFYEVEPIDTKTAAFTDVAQSIVKPDISLKVRGTMHMAPAVTFIEKVQNAGVDLLVQNSRTGKLTPLSPVSMQTAGIDDTLNLWVAPNQDLKEAESAIDTILDKPLDRQGTSLTRDTAPKSKQEVLDNVRRTFVDNHSEAALKTAEDMVKTKPKFASKVLKGLSKLDVGQEVIEKGLSKLGTKYGATAFTGPAAGILAFYETLVLAADVANAATKAIDKDVDFFDNFGEVDEKWSITYKLTKPFYETLFKGINNVTSNDNQDNEVQYSMESSK
jgi:hypothetical protein